MPLMMVDVDSTLYDADPLFASLAREQGLPWVARSNYWFQPQDIGVDRQALSNMFRKAHSREVVLDQVPYIGSVRALHDLDSDGWDIHYVSARHPQTQTALADWIASQGFPQPENVLCVMDKKPWIKEQSPLVVVDDRVQTILYARYEANAQVFAIRHSHNTNLTNEVAGIHIHDTWTEIRDGIRHTFE